MRLLPSFHVIILRPSFSSLSPCRSPRNTSNGSRVALPGHPCPALRNSLSSRGPSPKKPLSLSPSPVTLTFATAGRKRLKPWGREAVTCLWTLDPPFPNSTRFLKVSLYVDDTRRLARHRFFIGSDRGRRFELAPIGFFPHLGLEIETIWIRVIM